MNAKNLLARMEVLNISAYRLSQISKVPQSAISRYKTGEREASEGNLLAIADALGCSVDYLMGRTNNPEINR